MEFIRRWYKRTFADPQVGILAFLLVVSLVLVLFVGQWLVPVFTALVLAYLLEGQVAALERRGVGRFPAVLTVFLVFMAFAAFVLFLLVPLLIKQITQLLQILPNLVADLQRALERLPEKYPQIISEDWVSEVASVSQAQATALINQALTYSAASVVWLFYLVLYLVIVPLMVFFFMKDKEGLLDWFAGLMPRDRGLAVKVWRDVDRQIGNYVRGKFFEILIVWGVSFAVFALLGLPFSALLGLLVGLSVLVPYIGAAAVTIPIAVVAYLEWGFQAQFVWVMVAYAVIQALDGNLLAPLLFAEVVDLHPIAIIVAVLFFGGLWGFWGVFFAIPLATVVKAVLDAWPRAQRERAQEESVSKDEEHDGAQEPTSVEDGMPAEETAVSRGAGKKP